MYTRSGLTPTARNTMRRDRHYRGDYDVRAKKVRDRANADPTTVCWRCGLRLEQHQPHHNGSPPRWTAGHLHDGDPASPLLPEVSSCNFRAGAHHGNTDPFNTTLNW